MNWNLNACPVSCIIMASSIMLHKITLPHYTESGLLHNTELVSPDTNS